MKPSVLFILHMPPPVHGAAMVGKYIHDSESVNSEFDCRYINLTTASGMGDIGHFKFKKIIAFWHLLSRIHRSVKELQPNYVYITPNAKGGPFYKDFIVVMMLKLNGCKVVAHYHNKGVAKRQGRPIDHFLYKRFFKRLKVILLSEFLYPDIQKYVKKEDVFICPNGISERIEKSNVNNEKSCAVPHVLFLSNLLKDKGVLVLLDALKILKGKGCSFVCDFVGDETADINATRFEEEIQIRDLAEMAYYRGKQYGKDKDHYLDSSDIFVHPTNDDCFPLVLLEAMQHGLSIVTTDEGGIPDIVKDGENGYLCEKNNPEDLAEKLMLLLNDKQLRLKMGQDGYKKYQEMFTLEIFERRFSDILHTITE